MNCDKYITEVFLRSNKQYPSIGSDYGLALTMRQAINWTNAGNSIDAYMHHWFVLAAMDCYQPRAD